MNRPPSYEDVINTPSFSLYPSLSHDEYRVETSLSPAQKKRPKMKAIQLFESSKDKQRYEELADLFSVIKATEVLEVLYGRGELPHADYQRECIALIRQYQMIEKALISRNWITSTESFMNEYGIQCPRAYVRLVREGTAVDKEEKGAKVLVLDTVQSFIGAKDALDLNERAVDRVQPYISDIMNNLRRMTSFGLPADFIGIIKISEWLQKINLMKAHEDLSEDDARQLLHDLDTSYSALKTHLAT
eukprot:gene5085-10177_t